MNPNAPSRVNICERCKDSGIKSKCIECKRLRQRNWYRRNAEKSAEWTKRYRKEHREKYLANKRKYEQEKSANDTQYRARKAEIRMKWIRKNPEKFAELRKKARLRRDYGDFDRVCRILQELKCELKKETENKNE